MSGSTPSVTIGPYVVGEIQAPLEYRFLDATGAAINLSGYTAKFIWRAVDGSPVVTGAVVTDPADGKVTYTWTGAELTEAGPHWAEFWVGNTTNKFASLRLEFSVRVSVGPVPMI